ncbi:hypothetical protein ViNHUV68_18350 [Vibrio sp. NH-UV-68]
MIIILWFKTYICTLNRADQNNTFIDSVFIMDLLSSIKFSRGGVFWSACLDGIT